MTSFTARFNPSLRGLNHDTSYVLRTRCVFDAYQRRSRGLHHGATKPLSDGPTMGKVWREA